MPPHPVTNFEIQKYYQNDGQLSWQNEPKFNDVCSRNNLNKTKDEEYVINLDEYESIGTHFYMRTVIAMQYILIALELNKFQKKMRNS